MDLCRVARGLSVRHTTPSLILVPCFKLCAVSLLLCLLIRLLLPPNLQKPIAQTACRAVAKCTQTAAAVTQNIMRVEPRC